MGFLTCYHGRSPVLMEGALGERLKREYNLEFDDEVAMAGLIYVNEGQNALMELWGEYISIALRYHLPFIATTPTRRANRERVERSGYTETIVRDNVDFLKKVRDLNQTDMYIGGLMGCKGDAYKVTEVLSCAEAKEFHSWQANQFKEAGADFLFAGIMPALPEASGIAQAMGETGLPYIISFMIRDNGCLLDGTPIHDAIRDIDRTVRRPPVCYMANCVHPKVVYSALQQDFNQTSQVRERFCGIQANASPLSPEELDDCVELKCSGSVELADEIFRLKDLIRLRIVGGCCGTDNTHLEQIARRLSVKDDIQCK